ncbi:chemotaxis protein [Rhodobacter xanthinilyticus]|uniref:Chemotaxis protein n=1 Tax=Rhodobacter xanthinilyticus TaxID=1850250 RepID=A0A1D9MBF0_9RHOB|nr:methyl-accepting chemotaxis protein [Rhodobacter xanthinilyticus]AOZ69049.1 chemotaxis protein [Rhodobacter xanthinilyticus]
MSKLNEKGIPIRLSKLYRIPARIYAIVLIAALALAGLSEGLLKLAVSNAYDMRETHLSDVTDTAISALAHLQDEVDSGTITLEQAQAEARLQLTAMTFADSGYFYALDTKGVMLVHPTQPDWVNTNKLDYVDAKGTPIFVEMLKLVEAKGSGMLRYYFTKPGSTETEMKLGFVRIYEPWGWVVGTGSYVSDIEAALAHLRKISLGALAGAVAVLMLISTLLARSVTIPLEAIIRRMGSMTAGDAASAVPFTSARSDIGDMARAIDTFRAALIEKQALEESRREKDEEMRRAEQAAQAREEELRQREAAAQEDRRRQEAEALRDREAARAAAEVEREAQMREQERVVTTLAANLKAMSEGDLTVAIVESFPPGYEQLRVDFNAAVTRFAELAGAIIETGDEIQSEAASLNNASTELGRRTETQAASLEETAAAMNEIAASVDSSADGARNAARAVGKTRDKTALGRDVVKQTLTAMNDIAHSSEKISRITSVIDDIAFQTNLLALNAGVEAARAGESGRGFAVVASEVRALAQRSSEAAREIAELISTSEAQVKSGVTLASQSDDALGAIGDLVSELDSVIKTIAASAAEQSVGISEVTTAVNQLDQVTQQNAAMFEENSAAVQALLAQARALKQLSAVFTIDAEARAMRLAS